MMPEQLSSDDPRLTSVLKLIQSAFAEHDGRIDPPSSMHRLSLQDVVMAARAGQLWAMGNPPVACVILRVQDDALYLSKLAVSASERGKGYAGQLIRTAEDVARSKGLKALTLQTRIELRDNHAVFRALGFEIAGETAHPGFDRTTSLTMRKDL